MTWLISTCIPHVYKPSTHLNERIPMIFEIALAPHSGNVQAFFLVRACRYIGSRFPGPNQSISLKSIPSETISVYLFVNDCWWGFTYTKPFPKVRIFCKLQCSILSKGCPERSQFADKYVRSRTLYIRIGRNCPEPTDLSRYEPDVLSSRPGVCWENWTNVPCMVK